MDLKNINKIHSHVEFFQTFAALDIFNSGDVIQRQVQVFQLFEFVEVFHFLDDVVLKVKDL